MQYLKYRWDDDRGDEHVASYAALVEPQGRAWPYRPVIWLACEPELTGCGSTGRREECQQRRFEKRRPTRRTLECR
jgi:hypothetical protein